eukprot:2121926-Rhodomonas_salina.1
MHRDVDAGGGALPSVKSPWGSQVHSTSPDRKDQSLLRRKFHRNQSFACAKCFLRGGQMTVLRGRLLEQILQRRLSGSTWMRPCYDFQRATGETTAFSRGDARADEGFVMSARLAAGRRLLEERQEKEGREPRS